MQSPFRIPAKVKTISVFKLRPIHTPSSQLFQITNIKLHKSLSALRFQDVNSSLGSHTIEREIHGETITKYYSWKLDQKNYLWLNDGRD